MKLCIKPIASVLAGVLAASPGLHGEPVQDREAAPHFWDPIPVSPSTTVPGEIRDDYWRGQYERVNREVAGADQAEIVFFGDSITWHWSLGAATGREVWKREYARHHPINMGNSGDITPVMLYRVTRGNLDFAAGQQPKVAVLLCGTNNFVVRQSAGGEVRWELGADCPPADVAAGVRAIAQVVRRHLPRTRVIMMGILPVANQAKWAKCQQVNAINAALDGNKDEVTFVDLQERFLKPDGSIDQRLFTDGTHLTPEGYQVWAESIAPLVAKMMKADPPDPVKIMLIGDSVTEGTNSAGAYRRHLDGMLRRKGLLIDFVGSRRKHHDNTTAPDSYEYDVDHEGHWGRNSGWLAGNMPGLLSGQKPDVAVIHIGTEDIVSSSSAVEPLTDEVVGNIGTVIEALRAQNPKVRIVLAKIIPVRGKVGAVALLNRKVSRLVSARSTPSSPLVVADLANGFDLSKDLAADGILPSPRGAENMAEVFADVVHELVTGTGNR